MNEKPWIKFEITVVTECFVNPNLSTTVTTEKRFEDMREAEIYFNHSKADDCEYHATTARLSIIIPNDRLNQ